MYVKFEKIFIDNNVPYEHRNTMDVLEISDKELLEKLMRDNDWTQEQLAEQLFFVRSNVSKVITGRQKLRRATRVLAERLLNELEE